ncbi:MAG: nucleotidyltransferase family protein [Alphaproteobacteria bacterium]|nr:nucleotidyltransferase family protein [Alphaproteobacteria bacterium]
MTEMPRHAMVLAAGKGVRLRPITDRVPKPLVRVDGRALINYSLDALIAAGVREAVVNAHYLADMIEAFIADYQRAHPALRLHLSREHELLETGGGVVRARKWLGEAPFYVLNSDVIVRDAATFALRRLAQAFDPTRMDALLLLQPVSRALGYDGQGDYLLATDGRLSSRADAPSAPFVFTGAQILTPRFLEDAPAGAFSLKLLYDRAEAARRLFGLTHDGAWLHIGTPEALALAERAIADAR